MLILGSPNNHLNPYNYGSFVTHRSNIARSDKYR